MIDTIEGAVVVGSAGLLAARPTAGKGRAFYYATDNSTIYFDTGSAWRELTTVGGVAASGVLIGGASSEGSSLNAARADHVHALPLATTSANGAMAAADKALLAGATSAPTANTLVKNDASGRFQVAAPSAAADVAPKSYVDAQVGTRALSSHTHTWAQITGTPSTYAPSAHTHPWEQITGAPATYAPDAHNHTAAEITSGVFSTARLPVSTQTAPGTMSAADKLKLDKASSTSAASTLMMTDAAGRYQSAAPSAAADVANKAYVDAQVDTAAPLAHSHSWAQVTGKPTTFAPSAHSHAWAEITSKPTTFAPSSHDHDASDTVSGVFNAARIPIATASVHGAMPAADKAKLDAATVLATPGTLALRNSGGQIQVATPGSAPDAANKDYVDDKIATRAASSHSHSWSSITSKPSSFNPSSHEHGSLENGSHYLRLDGAGRVYGSALWDRTYDNLPNMYLTNEGTLGRALRSVAASDHNHSASDITSGTLPYARIRGTDEVHARTATNRSVWVDSDGRFGQNTSSIRFKENVRDADLDPAAILRLRPRVYDRKNREEGVNEFGLIAEEVEAEAPILALYDRDGVLETVAYEKLAVALLAVVQDQDRRLKAAGL